MKFAVLDVLGLPVAFYDNSIHKEIPIGAIEITEAQWLECINNQGTRKFVDRVLVEYVPQKTQVQLDNEMAQVRDDAMLQGFIYGTNIDGTDRYISVTKDDGDGMVQVKMGFDLDPSPTVIHFKNGSNLPMTIEEFATFAPLFVAERKKFFV
ncbi:hypothetical protein [Sulfuricurvum sp.]|uniref:hypothetical protein n=1 Tax=Sulfuricurvum sp. TaxID=2025608 RepID=UPI003BAE8C9A